MELTPQEIELFRHNGFIKFPTQLSKDHVEALKAAALKDNTACLLYTSPSPRDRTRSRMPSSA